MKKGVMASINIFRAKRNLKIIKKTRKVLYRLIIIK